MIDWIKAVIPCQHENIISGGKVISLKPDSGEIEWQVNKRLSVEGSYSSTVQVKTDDIGLLLIDGNPSKFLQGHNIFGTNDLIGLCYEFFSHICKALGIQPSSNDLEAWRTGNYDLKRIDVTESFHLPSQKDVAAWLRAAAPMIRGKHQAASAYSGETIYIGQKSRRIALKIYNKWLELKKHPLPLNLPFRDELVKYSETLLRVEVRLLSMELKHRGLNKGAAWKDTVTAEKIHRERIETIKMSEKMRLTADEIEDLPPRLLAVYKLWQQGEDLRTVYPKTTFYRYRSDLVKHGIDISTPQPKKAEVIPLIRFLTAEQVAEAPEWAANTAIYFK